MEVAQIGRGLVLQLRNDCPSQADLLPPLELIETIAFAHDLGHPPYGHAGEVALNFMMRNAGGFEGNGQSLRLVCCLEPNVPGYGLDLTRRTLMGILKYPRPYSEVRQFDLPQVPDRLTQLRSKQWKPPKCYMDSEHNVVDWLLEPFAASDRERLTSLKTDPEADKHGVTAAKTLDCSIMELADDIAYGIHDFEDGVALGLIPIEATERLIDVIRSDWGRSYGLDKPSVFGHQLLEPSSEGGNRKAAIGALVHAMISSVGLATLDGYSDPILGTNAVLAPEAKALLKMLKEMAYRYMIGVPEIQTLEYRGGLVVMSIFEVLASEPERLLTPNFLAAYTRADSDAARLRAVCDYVAGMTDPYATRIYERLFVPRQGSMFERL
jgi:dGTPase